MGIDTRPNAIVAVSMALAGMQKHLCDPRTSTYIAASRLAVASPHAMTVATAHAS
jgi:hypothetical protein